MKKTIYIAAALLVAASCNSQKFDYDDFDYQSVYFPYQYPVRTLSLGNDVLDNSLDKAHQFNIGVDLGGVYLNNDCDRTVHFVVDDSMVGNNLYNKSNLLLKAMPSDYYTLSSYDKVVIPKGEVVGKILVQMQDAFFEDPDSYKGIYVIPLRITGADKVDTVLRGKAVEGFVGEPDRHNASDWDTTPMDYTLFGVKYVNPWHGSWLRRGMMTVKTPEGVLVDRVEYIADALELNDVVSLSTTSMTKAEGSWQISSEKMALVLDVDSDKNVAISSQKGASISVTGTGSYAEGAEEWGGTLENPRKRDVLYLNYNYSRANGNICNATDTLVFRDRGIVIETDRPTIK